MSFDVSLFYCHYVKGGFPYRTRLPSIFSTPLLIGRRGLNTLMPNIFSTPLLGEDSLKGGEGK